MLRTVRGPDAALPEFVPRLSVTVAYLLAVGSVIMLVVFLAHLAQPDSHRDDAARRQYSADRTWLRPSDAPPTDIRRLKRASGSTGVTLLIDAKRVGGSGGETVEPGQHGRASDSGAEYLVEAEGASCGDTEDGEVGGRHEEVAPLPTRCR